MKRISIYCLIIFLFIAKDLLAEQENKVSFTRDQVCNYEEIKEILAAQSHVMLTKEQFAILIKTLEKNNDISENKEVFSWWKVAVLCFVMYRCTRKICREIGHYNTDGDSIL